MTQTSQGLGEPEKWVAGSGPHRSREQPLPSPCLTLGALGSKIREDEWEAGGRGGGPPSPRGEQVCALAPPPAATCPPPLSPLHLPVRLVL